MFGFGFLLFGTLYEIEFLFLKKLTRFNDGFDIDDNSHIEWLYEEKKNDYETTKSNIIDG